MTVLHETNPVTRETCCYYRRRALVVKLKPLYLEIRQKGLRSVETIDYETVYETAAKLRWRREQAEKMSARRTKKGR
jgi:hypothetical protein